jgi:hypothetical protein
MGLNVKTDHPDEETSQAVRAAIEAYNKKQGEEMKTLVILMVVSLFVLCVIFAAVIVLIVILKKPRHSQTLMTLTV